MNNQFDHPPHITPQIDPEFDKFSLYVRYLSTHGGIYPKLGYHVRCNTVRFMDTNANKAIGATLQTMRIEAGLTQVQLAKILGKPQSYVSKVEMGERSLHVSELFLYSQALGLAAKNVVERIGKALDCSLPVTKRKI